MSMDVETWSGHSVGMTVLLIATQSGLIKTSIPDLNMHFPEDMLILEKWEPTKPISAIYYDGVKERYFGKRFSH